MKTLLNKNDYYIYEFHSNEKRRKFDIDEQSLWVELY
jgi:hypothetical protein